MHDRSDNMMDLITCVYSKHYFTTSSMNFQKMILEWFYGQKMDSQFNQKQLMYSQLSLMYLYMKFVLIRIKNELWNIKHFMSLPGVKCQFEYTVVIGTYMLEHTEVPIIRTRVLVQLIELCI